MAGVLFGSNLDLDHNELQNARIQTVAALPAIVAANAGWLVRLETDGALYLQSATEWVPMGAGTAGFQRVRVASTATVDTATLNTGDTIDGVVLALGDRVLLKNQADPIQNGIWRVGAIGATRDPAADTAAEMPSGTLVVVDQGTVAANTVWMLGTDAGFVIGVNPLTFVPAFGGGTELTAGPGFAIVGDEIRLDPAATPRIARLVTLPVPAAGVGETDVDLVHNLNVAGPVSVTVQRVSDSRVVIVDVVRTDANTVTVDFTTGPVAGQYTATIIG